MYLLSFPPPSPSLPLLFPSLLFPPPSLLFPFPSLPLPFSFLPFPFSFLPSPFPSLPFPFPSTSPLCMLLCLFLFNILFVFIAQKLSHKQAQQNWSVLCLVCLHHFAGNISQFLCLFVGCIFLDFNICVRCAHNCLSWEIFTNSLTFSAVLTLMPSCGSQMGAQTRMQLSTFINEWAQIHYSEEEFLILNGIFDCSKTYQSKSRSFSSCFWSVLSELELSVFHLLTDLFQLDDNSTINTGLINLHTAKETAVIGHQELPAQVTATWGSILTNTNLFPLWYYKYPHTRDFPGFPQWPAESYHGYTWKKTWKWIGNHEVQLKCVDLQVKYTIQWTMRTS